MKEDPVVEEVRAVRKAIESACGGNRELFAQRLRALEAGIESRLVRREPKARVRRNRVAEAGAKYGSGAGEGRRQSDER